MSPDKKAKLEFSTDASISGGLLELNNWIRRCFARVKPTRSLAGLQAAERIHSER